MNHVAETHLRRLHGPDWLLEFCSHNKETQHQLRLNAASDVLRLERHQRWHGFWDVSSERMYSVAGLLPESGFEGIGELARLKEDLLRMFGQQ